MFIFDVFVIVNFFEVEVCTNTFATLAALGDTLVLPEFGVGDNTFSTEVAYYTGSV